MNRQRGVHSWQQIRVLLVAALFLFLFLPAPAGWTAQAARIDRISTDAARAGETVTITGTGFGARNVVITVGGVPAQVVSATGSQATFRVPPATPPGLTHVTATNPGGLEGSIAFNVLEGILLPGNPSARAVDATFDLAPIAVDASRIANGVIMTRLDLHLLPDATVADVNAALQGVDGGIVTMLRGFPALTIAIPAASDLAGLSRTVQVLRASRGVAWTDLGRVAAPKRLPPSPAGDQINFDQLAHLLAAGFPAAWNVSSLATDGCAARKVTVLVADTFGFPLIGGEADFFDEVPTFVDLGGAHPRDDTHGYEVTTTLAALFNETNPTGANPFTDCLTIEGVELAGFTEFQRTWLIPAAFPSGKFLLNYSQGYEDRCLHTANQVDDACTPDQAGTFLDAPLMRAYAAADWKALTSDRWRDFLVGVAAGNEANKPGTAIYPGLGRAAFDSPISVATLTDPLFGFVQDGASWDAHAQPAPGGFPTMKASDPEMQALQQYLRAVGADAIEPADNVLIVGSTTEPGFDGLVNESDSSDVGADVMAVGEGIPTLSLIGLGVVSGTSFSAPQVTGLASYLWLLARGIAAVNPGFADLSRLSSAATREAILANTQRAGLASGAELIDAYAAVLSLDAGALPGPANAPVRRRLLNVNTGGASAARFDEADIAEFLSNLFAKDANGNFVVDASGNPVEPAAADYGRYDLNGDGFTGGTRKARFDLDRVGSTQFGAPKYSIITQAIEENPVEFDENALSDLDILCYYAYSDLYEGDREVRRQLLSQLPGNQRCTHHAVTIQPTSVTLGAGATQQFVATVHGSADPRVTWSATGGTISDTGLFTAGTTSGTFSVTATSAADPTASSTAQVTIVVQGNVTITSVSGSVGVGGFDCLLESTNERLADAIGCGGAMASRSGLVSVAGLSISGDALSTNVAGGPPSNAAGASMEICFTVATTVQYVATGGLEVSATSNGDAVAEVELAGITKLFLVETGSPKSDTVAVDKQGVLATGREYCLSGIGFAETANATAATASMHFNVSVSLTPLQ
jgi:hypothetical protein